MNRKVKKTLTSARVIILLVVLVLSVVAIHPNPFKKGVAIRTVLLNSSAYVAGIESPAPTATPMSRETITSINNMPINGVADYNKIVEDLSPNRTIVIKTDKGTYRVRTRQAYNIIELNETEIKNITKSVQKNATINGTNTTITTYYNETVEVPKTLKEPIGVEDIGIKVYDTPTTNIRKGLDLQGGTRVLLQPETKLSDDDIGFLIDNMKQRLNVYGLSDLIIKEAGDLSGNQYVLIEIAGANEEEVKGLLSQQGKFEARIANETVFIGGRDITYVCRSADCAGLDPQVGCGRSDDNWFCRFRFSITITNGAAKRQAELTQNLEVITEDEQQYLSESLILYLDDQSVDELRIGAELKGRDVTDISISGSGVGATEQQAAFNALQNMKELQTVLKTGSLPVKLNIVKTDAVSPVLGEEFVKNAIIMGILAIFVVAIVVYIRYRKLTIALPIFMTSLSEVIILLGVASLIGWNLDLAAIAGIIIAVGTGVDHQIVITDETMGGESQSFNWKDRIKKAFFIIMAAYITTFVAMLPLVFAGAGLLKGFAITTLIGVSIGVFIARPAYAAVIEILAKE